jgi:pimeloyl-ACP methyl ester carboxylesterase
VSDRVILPTGVTLAVADDGAGDPPLLLVHGVGGHGDDWDAQRAAFVAAGHRTIVPDLRGHGASTVPEDGYGPRDYAGDLVALLVALGVQGPVVGVGHSLGAVVLSNLARERPELLRGAVLIDPTYGDGPELREAVTALVRDLHARRDAVGAADALGGREGAGTPPALAAAHRARILATPAHVLTGTIAGLHDNPEQVMHRPEVDAVLRERAVPLLVFHAQPGKGAWEATLQADPRSRVVDWGGAGHWMQHERADELNTIILEWIATL